MIWSTTCQAPIWQWRKKILRLSAAGGNWVVRLGKARRLRVYSLLFALAYLSLALLFLLTKNPLWLLTFVSLPLAVRAVRTAASALNNISEFIGANVNTFYIYQLTGLFMLVSALLCSRF